jgi:hypothetical protein
MRSKEGQSASPAKAGVTDGCQGVDIVRLVFAEMLGEVLVNFLQRFLK